jgi:diguanylate cyclase (GGDEF)-like protein
MAAGRGASVGWLVRSAVAVALAAVGAASLWAAHAAPPSPWWRLAVAAAVIAAGTKLRCAIRVARARIAFVWGDAGVVLAACLVPAPWVVLAAAGGQVAARLLPPYRQARQKAIFNGSIAVVGTAAAMTILPLLDATPVRLDSGRDVLGLVLASLAFGLVTDVATTGIMARDSGRSFHALHREGRLIQAVSLVGNGVAAAGIIVIAHTDPRLLLVAVFGVLGLQQGYAGLLQVGRERRRRHELAHAISQLGAVSACPDRVSDSLDHMDAPGVQAAEDAVLARAARIAADLFAADLVEVDLWTGPDDPGRMHRHYTRSPQDDFILPAADVQPTSAIVVANGIFQGHDVHGAIRLAFSGLTAPPGFNERECADLETLTAAVPAAIIGSRRAYEAQLRAAAEHRATHDALTGLPNRQLLIAITTSKLATNDQRALLLVEVPGLRELVRTLGHTAGDRLLIGVARRIERLAADGVVAYLDGTRFAVLMKGVTDSESQARELQRALAEPIDMRSGPVSLAVPVGIADAAGPLDAGELLRRADVALSAATRSPTRLVRYYPAMDVESAPRMLLATSLAGALTGGAMNVRYQIAIDLVTREPTSCEIQPSWSDPRWGAIAGEQLLDLVGADLPDLQIEYVRWLLDTALDARLEWGRRSVGVPMVLRLPPRALFDPALPSRVAGALASHSVPAQELILCVDDPTPLTAIDVADVLASLRAYGVQIAVDRLSVLERYPALPATHLRLPADLVDAADIGRGAQAVIAATATAARRLGLHVTALGVDTAQHEARLRDFGCHSGQGAHLWPPADRLKTGRMLWIAAMNSEVRHPPGEVIVLARRPNRNPPRSLR